MIRPAPGFVCLLVALCALPAVGQAAAPWAPGVNLRWNNCYSDNGAWNKTFACNTNAGFEEIIGSFELAQPMNSVLAGQVVIDIRSASPALPEWWSLAYSGGCRNRSLDFQPSGISLGVNCMFWMLGPVGGGLGAYAVGVQGPSHVRVSGVFGSPTSTPGADLAAGVEYYMFRLSIDHAKTVGSGSCSGCDVPVCVFLSRISLFQKGASTAAIHLERGANYLGSQYVTWQNAYPVDVHHVCEPGTACSQHYSSFGCVLSSPTAQRRSTWGQVKALFR